MDQTVILVFNLAVLILSVVIHEVSHGLMANRLGDPTAKDLGRLSFNPLKHLDFMGSFLIPFLTYIGGGFIFGWAKPVPYNPYNLKNQKWGPALVAAAGPASNFIVAIVFGLVLRFVPAIPFATALAVSVIVYINILLGVFNLVPIPPLDGSKILAGFLPYRYERQFLMLERWGMFLVILFIFFLFPLLSPVIPFMFRFITGSSFMF
ncbi:MAG: site-2 protease family protein [Patescibacteria group bacterium]